MPRHERPLTPAERRARAVRVTVSLIVLAAVVGMLLGLALAGGLLAPRRPALARQWEGEVAARLLVDLETLVAHSAIVAGQTSPDRRPARALRLCFGPTAEVVWFPGPDGRPDQWAAWLPAIRPQRWALTGAREALATIPGLAPLPDSPPADAPHAGENTPWAWYRVTREGILLSSTPAAPPSGPGPALPHLGTIMHYQSDVGWPPPLPGIALDDLPPPGTGPLAIEWTPAGPGQWHVAVRIANAPPREPLVIHQPHPLLPPPAPAEDTP
jgi:hypothetical protein